MESKICNTCNLEQSLECFSKCKRNKDGLQHKCKSCAKEYKTLNSKILSEKEKIYKKNNADKIAEYQKQYRKDNLEHLTNYKKQQYEYNKEDVLERQKEYRENNKKILAEKQRSYNKENPDIIKNWRKLNREEIAKYQKEYKKQYQINNPHITAWRNILRRVLKQFGKTKDGFTIDLLGYSANDLKSHICALFTEEMSWDNYGEWQIDHIVGVRHFDPETPPSIVNALSNLRPMWATTREINGVIYEGNLNRRKY